MVLPYLAVNPYKGSVAVHFSSECSCYLLVVYLLPFYLRSGRNSIWLWYMAIHFGMPWVGAYFTLPSGCIGPDLRKFNCGEARQPTSTIFKATHQLTPVLLPLRPPFLHQELLMITEIIFNVAQSPRPEQFFHP